MTTRGQKKTIDASQSNISENGTILNLLTGGETVVVPEESNPEMRKIDAQSSKDVTKESNGDPAKAKDPILPTNQATVPVITEISSEHSRLERVRDLKNFKNCNSLK